MTCFLFAACFLCIDAFSGCISDGRRGRCDKVWQDRHLQLSQFCQTVQRYCSSAVIMIGALQVVLDGLIALLFLSDARPPAPALA